MSMGETKEAEKGEARGDAKTSGLTSPSKKGSTSGGEPETFTKEQVEKEISDRLTDAGRTSADLEKREAAIKEREEAAQKAEDERIERAKQEKEARDAKDLEALADDPDAQSRLKKIQQRERAAAEKERANKQKETQLEADKLSHQAEIDAARETRREIDVWEVAKDNGLDVVLLKETCGEFNAQSREQIEKVAKALAKGKAPEPPPPPPTPDSGRTSGGGQMPEKAKDKIKSGFADIHK
jgi:hypothetical protein